MIGGEAQLRKILSRWELDAARLTPLEDAVWDVNGDWILKRSAAEAVEKSARLSRRLRAAGLGAPDYRPTVSGEIYVPGENGVWCLMTRLGGTHAALCQEDDAFARRLGGSIAALHEALRGTEEIRAESDLPGELERYILPELEEKQLPVPPEATDFVRRGLETFWAALPRQPIHRDLHMKNLLFAEGRLTGVLDPELCVRSSRVYDLCYLLLSELVGHTEDPAYCARWTRAAYALLAGYAEISPISREERESVPVLLLDIELLFTAFWSRAGATKPLTQALALTDWLWAGVRRGDVAC